MKGSISNVLVALLAALSLFGLAWTPVTDAAPPRGGGGGAHASAGGRTGGGGGNRQVDSSKADPRTINDRSTSANSVNNVNSNRNTNVNASRNTNVNVNNGGGCCGGWDNDYHPVAGAMAVGAAVAVMSAVIGSMVPSVPPSCVPVNYGAWSISNAVAPDVSRRDPSSSLSTHRTDMRSKGTAAPAVFPAQTGVPDWSSNLLKLLMFG
jgi:hypothetical protein